MSPDIPVERVDSGVIGLSLERTDDEGRQLRINQNGALTWYISDGKKKVFVKSLKVYAANGRLSFIFLISPTPIQGLLIYLCTNIKLPQI